MFPCTGRSTCKSPATQVQEIIDYVGSKKMIVGRLWLDVEVDSAANNWPSTSSARTSKLEGNKQVYSVSSIQADNLILPFLKALQSFKSALDASGWKWGIYSSRSQWTQITGSASWVLDSSVPLWYAVSITMVYKFNYLQKTKTHLLMHFLSTLILALRLFSQLQ